jgi:membrane-associated protein
MHGLMQLSGLVALLLIAGVLFAEECGVPLPFLPGDVLLAAGGILAASGRLSLLLFIAATSAAMCAGALIGHTWSRALGLPALRRVAVRVGRGDQLDRASERMRSSGWVGVLVCRLLPGMRVYTNLAAGIASVSRRTFVTGLMPSVLAWTVGFSLLGYLIGHPAERVLARTGGAVPMALLAIALLVVVLGAALRIPARGPRCAQHHTARRVLLATILDTTIGMAAVVGVVEGVEAVLRHGDNTLVVQGLIAAGVLLTYLAVSRQAAGATAGEGLLSVSYRRSRPG